MFKNSTEAATRRENEHNHLMICVSNSTESDSLIKMPSECNTFIKCEGISISILHSNLKSVHKTQALKRNVTDCESTEYMLLQQTIAFTHCASCEHISLNLNRCEREANLNKTNLLFKSAIYLQSRQNFFYRFHQ